MPLKRSRASVLVARHSSRRVPRRSGNISAMRITTLGSGTVGGGLAARWRNAGHEVTELGPDGGDASDADAVLVAVPSGAIDDALSKVTGLEGQAVIDTTNHFPRINQYAPFGGPDESFPSLPHPAASPTNRP